MGGGPDLLLTLELPKCDLWGAGFLVFPMKPKLMPDCERDCVLMSVTGRMYRIDCVWDDSVVVDFCLLRRLLLVGLGMFGDRGRLTGWLGFVSLAEGIVALLPVRREDVDLVDDFGKISNYLTGTHRERIRDLADLNLNDKEDESGQDNTCDSKADRRVGDAQRQRNEGMRRRGPTICRQTTTVTLVAVRKGKKKAT